MNPRRLLSAAALGAALLLSLYGTAGASVGVGVATCNQAHWCTITASGDVEQGASQLAIGNVPAGTALAVTQEQIGQQSGRRRDPRRQPQGQLRLVAVRPRLDATVHERPGRAAPIR